MLGKWVETGDVIHLLAASGLLRSLEAKGVAQHRQKMIDLSKEFGVLCSQTAYTVVEVGHPFFMIILLLFILFCVYDFNI
jgi:hypothetical protein